MTHPTDPMAEIRASFFVECEELLEALTDGLQAMDDGAADGETINAVFALDGAYGSDGGADEVRAALQPAWDALGITDADIGTLS